jgi:uracil-DNA glycosylase family protein
MMVRIGVGTFDEWREAARELLRRDINPAEVDWQGDAPLEPALAFEPPAEPQPQARVPARFLEMARAASRRDDPGKWTLLYRILYRLTHGEKNLLEMLSDADVQALRRMAQADAFVPAGADLPAMREAIQGCQGCELYRAATQAVFGEGPPAARLVFVGEQPGDQEDLQGRPFVGPAGKLLDQALAQVRIPRAEVYITNAVKHFKFILIRGKRRLHQTPQVPEIQACRSWLEAEISVIHPRLIVCLGATASQSVLGRTVRVLRERGQFYRHPWAEWVTLTIHPSALLRIEDEQQREIEYTRFCDDLRRAKEKLDSPGT